MGYGKLTIEINTKEEYNELMCRIGAPEHKKIVKYRIHLPPKNVVTFDFDDTLSTPEVQELCSKLLQEKGVDVYVVTARYNQLLRHNYWEDTYSNDDLWDVCQRLGIDNRNVIFTNLDYKWSILNQSGARVHLEDCPKEIKEAKYNKCYVPYVDIKGKTSQELYEEIKKYID